MTGMTSSIIQSGLLPDSRKASTTLSRLAIFLRFASEVASFISLRSCSESPCTSIWRSSASTASPPMPAEKASSPSSSRSRW